MLAEPLPDDVTASRVLLDELYAEVAAAEGILSGGTKLGVGTEAVQSLRETRVSFGNPADSLIQLTPELFSSVGVELSEIQKVQLASGFAFYYLTLTVSLQTRSQARFAAIECSLDLGPKGATEPIVQSVFPTSRWREVLRMGGEASLALDGDLRWRLGLDAPAMATDVAVPGHLSAEVSSRSSMRGVFKVAEYMFRLGHIDIAATGEGNSRCFWRLENPELREVQTVQFGVVFKVPEHVSSVELVALCVARPKVSWLVGALRNAWSEISKRIQRVFDPDRPLGPMLVIGDHESWTIPLSP